MHGHDSQPIETLKLSDRDKSRLVQAVDAQAQLQAAQLELERRNIRVPYTGHNVLISLHVNGTSTRYSVVPRNIARYGLAFVHGRFVYPNTTCSVTLRQTDGRAHQIDGRVVRCRHIGGIVHEVSLKFEEPIDLERFVVLTPDQSDRHGQERAEHEADNPLNPQTCPTGLVLVVDDFAADRKLMAFHLKKQGLTVADAGNRAQANEAIKAREYDLAMIDLHLGREDGLELIRQFRASGFSQPIVAVSADRSDQMQARAMEAGANAFLTKPMDAKQLSEKVGQLMTFTSTEAAGDAVLSTLSQDREMRPLLREFVSSLSQSITLLREAGPDDDNATIREVCQQLSGAGTSYGFESITKTAELVLESLDADTKKAEQVRASVNDLLGLLRRVQFV